MLSLYDALTFSINKKNLFFGVGLAIVILLCFVTTGMILEKDFVIFSALKNLVPASKDIRNFNAIAQVMIALKQVSFWQTLYPKAIWITCLFVSASFVFFAQALILSKKKLFHLSENLSVPFLIKTLIKLLLLFLPLAVSAYFYVQQVLFSVFAFGVQTAMNTHPSYAFPFTCRSTILYIVLAIIYLYYTTCLFIDHFSFSSLFRTIRFIKHVRTVFELIFLHIVSIVLFLAIWCGIILIILHLNSPWVCCSFLTVYILIMIAVKNARYIFMLPVLVSLVIMGIGYGVLKNPAWFQLWPISVTALLSCTVYFVFWFMCLSVVAHLFSQTSFVFRFNKTASSDIKDIAPEKMRRMEEIYNEYLHEHDIEHQDNFFDHISQITREEKTKR